MRAHLTCLLAAFALTVVACSKSASDPPRAIGGTGGSPSGRGGSDASAGGVPPAGGVGGQAGTGGTPVTASGGAAGVAADSGAPQSDVALEDSSPYDGATTATDAPGGSDGAAGNGDPREALLVVGQVPGIGSDIQIRKALETKGLKVVEVLDSKSTTNDADGKALIVLSYSVESSLVATKFIDAPAAIIVMEHFLLESLGMTGKGHGWLKPATQITITSPDSPLAAGLPMGDVTVFSRSGSVFWGEPAPAAIKAATVKGNASRVSLFAYEKGAMMVAKAAPGRRLQFFLGAHLVPETFLNDTGMKLLEAAIAWCIR